MLYLLFGLSVMPIVVLATLGGDVTWFAMFAGEAAVVLMYFVVKKYTNTEPRITSNATVDVDADTDDENVFQDSIVTVCRLHTNTPLYDDE